DREVSGLCAPRDIFLRRDIFQRMLSLIELCLTALVVPLAYIAPRVGDRWFSTIERRMGRFAGGRGLAVVTVFLLALGARLAVLPIEPIPVAGIHDEFGYLLSGDTF